MGLTCRCGAPILLNINGVDRCADGHWQGIPPRTDLVAYRPCPVAADEVEPVLAERFWDEHDADEREKPHEDA